MKKILFGSMVLLILIVGINFNFHYAFAGGTTSTTTSTTSSSIITTATLAPAALTPTNYDVNFGYCNPNPKFGINVTGTPGDKVCVDDGHAYVTCSVSGYFTVWSNYTFCPDGTTCVETGTTPYTISCE